MKPILFNSNETAFLTNGIGILADAVSCVVTEERNGEYELRMTYPIGGVHYAELASRKIILAKPNQTDRPQPFRIYSISRPMGGLVTVDAEHLSYDMVGYPVEPFTAASLRGTMAGLDTHGILHCPFTMSSPIDMVGDFFLDKPASVKACMGAMVDTYGVEWKYDRFAATAFDHRGRDRGVSIRYGKNLTSLTQDENCADVYSAIYPYFTNSEVFVSLPEKIVAVPYASFTRALPVDFTGQFTVTPSEAELRQAAQEYIVTNNLAAPKVSLKVSFAQLEQDAEYKSKALLERVDLCDYVTVVFPKMGINVTAQCVKVVYDVLLDRVDSVELGDVVQNIADTIAKQTTGIVNLTTSVSPNVQNAITQQTAIATGNSGGYVVLRSTNETGFPNELLVLDAETVEAAQKIWRWNSAGLQYSSTGISGTFSTIISAADVNCDELTAESATIDELTASVVTDALTHTSGINGVRIEDGGIVFSASGSDVLAVKGDSITADGITYSGFEWVDVVGADMETYKVLGHKEA